MMDVLDHFSRIETRRRAVRGSNSDDSRRAPPMRAGEFQVKSPLGCLHTLGTDPDPRRTWPEQLDRKFADHTV